MNIKYGIEEVMIHIKIMQSLGGGEKEVFRGAQLFCACVA